MAKLFGDIVTNWKALRKQSVGGSFINFYKSTDIDYYVQVGWPDSYYGKPFVHIIYHRKGRLYKWTASQTYFDEMCCDITNGCDLNLMWRFSP